MKTAVKMGMTCQGKVSHRRNKEWAFGKTDIDGEAWLLEEGCKGENTGGGGWRRGSGTSENPQHQV